MAYRAPVTNDAAFTSGQVPVADDNASSVTGVNTTGSGNIVRATSPTLVTPALGTPSALVLTNATALPAAQVSSGALVNGMTATTQSAGDNTTTLATDAFVHTEIANAIAGVNPAIAVQAATTAAANTSGFTYNNGVGGIGAETARLAAAGFRATPTQKDVGSPIEVPVASRPRFISARIRMSPMASTSKTAVALT